MKNTREVLVKTAELRAEKAKKAADEKAEADRKAHLENPTQEDLLKEIRDLLKQNTVQNEPVVLPNTDEDKPVALSSEDDKKSEK